MNNKIIKKCGATLKECGATLKELWKDGCLEVSSPPGRRRSSPPLIKSVIQADADVMMYVSHTVLNDKPPSKKIVKDHFARLSRKITSLKCLDCAFKTIHWVIRIFAFLLMASGFQSLGQGETVCAAIGFIGAGNIFFIKRVAGFAVHIVKTIIKTKT